MSIELKTCEVIVEEQSIEQNDEEAPLLSSSESSSSDDSKYNDEDLKKLMAKLMKEITPEQMEECNNFMEVVMENQFIEFADFHKFEELTNSQQLFNRFIEKNWDQIPKFIKKDQTQDVLKKNKTFLRMVQNAFAVVYKQADHEYSKSKHHTMVWGHCGNGKTTLLKIIGTAFNCINPDDNNDTFVINDHQTGTTEVTKPIKVFFGTKELNFIDVPGTNDIRDETKEHKILKQIKQSEGTIDSILYVIDITQDRTTNEDILTMNNLAYAFKVDGIKIWEKVTVVFTKANAFNLERKQEPEYDDYGNDDDYFREYEEWMDFQNTELQKRIDQRKTDFRNIWLKLFNMRDLYPDTTEKEKIEMFNKIQFVVTGTVKKDRFIERGENEFKNCSILPIPNYKIPVPTDSELGIKLKQDIENHNFVLYPNWLQDILNKIISSSSIEFQVALYQINLDYAEKRARNLGDEVSEMISNRVDAGIQYTSRAQRALGRAAKGIFKDANNRNSCGFVTLALGTVGGGGALGIGASLIGGILGGPVAIGISAFIGSGLGYIGTERIFAKKSD